MSKNSYKLKSSVNMILYQLYDIIRILLTSGLIELKGGI